MDAIVGPQFQAHIHLAELGRVETDVEDALAIVELARDLSGQMLGGMRRKARQTGAGPIDGCADIAGAVQLDLGIGLCGVSVDLERLDRGLVSASCRLGESLHQR